MKISEFVDSLENKDSFKIVKKWIFWIILNEEAFFMSKTFNMKLTKLDKQNIKVGFPDNSKNKWLDSLKEKNISFDLYEKKDDKFIKILSFKWWNFSQIFSVDIEDYTLTKERILWLNKIWLEDKNEKNFLLKDKLEKIYLTLLNLLMKVAKKERYFFRQKVEKIFLDLFELVYEYMYNLWERKSLINSIFKKVMILREYTRFLYKMWKINNENIYLDLWDSWVEVLKICKGIMNKKV